MTNIVDSDFEQPFTVEDENGAVIDVSTWTFEVQWTRQGDNSPTFTLTDSVSFIDDGTDGECKFVLTAAQTKTIGPGVHRLVIWRTDSGRKVIGEGDAAFESLYFNA